jgi:molybdopterin-guanine dinucleotide biosynthesis protein A
MPNAVVLAGRQTSAGQNEFQNKALLIINGKPMIEYVLDTLNRCSLIDKVVIAGDREDLSVFVKGKVEAVIGDNGSIIKNTLSGIKYFDNDKDIIICTSDIPMITVEAIEDFIKQSQAFGMDLCYPIIDRKHIEARFPGVHRTYVKMKDGIYTGGNLFYVRPSSLGNSMNTIEALIAARKSPFQMARILGFSLLFKLFLGVLSIKQVENKFSKLMGIRAMAVKSIYPEIGNDVDKPSDVSVAARYINHQA